MCEGETIPLDVSRAEKYAIFPGQIVAVDGVNPSGNKIIASKIISDLNSTNKVEFPEKAKISLFAASGPYTTSDNLGFAPLADLLSEILKSKPDLAILIGPFLDARHEKVNEDLEEAFETFFASKILNRIVEAAKSAPNTRFMLVSSQFDVHHLPIYPTPPFITTEIIPDNVDFLADPSIFEVGNGLILGMTSTDILFHVGKEEISARISGDGDRLTRLSKHILSQKSFYPLYPPQEDLNVDFEHLEKHCGFEKQPHVTLFPSDFVHFIKDINGGVVVNPGRLAKSEGGGVYLKMEIKPSKTQNEDLKSRISAEIVRI